LNTYKQRIATRLKCLRENLADLIHLTISQRLQEDQKRIVRELDDVGFSIVENFLENDICKSFIQDIDRIIIDQKDHVWVDDQGSDHRIFGAENGSILIKDFFSNEWIRQIGEAHISSKLDNHMTLAARLEAQKENLGSGGGWHRDSTFEHQYKSILYLSDVSEENGPFQFISASHKTRSVISTVGHGVNNNRYTNEEIELLTRKNGWKLETFSGKAGTLILADTKGLHRGKPIQSGTRYALTNYYIGDYKKSQFEKYFKDLNKLPAPQ
jgi:ectoine hydroxylase-related dioxygenase (phytanoyl-CoA dioxygenase family)